MEIIVDDRERAGGLAEALRRAVAAGAGGLVANCDVRVARLALGDVQIGAALRIERKAAADFVASLAGGRLQTQLLAQLKAGGRVVLIVEGEFDAAAMGGFAERVVRRALLDVQLEMRLAVVRTRDVEDTAAWIVALAEREMTTAGQATHAKTLPFRPAPAGTKIHHNGPLPGHAARRERPAPLAPAVAELARIPGVGTQRAQALFGHFGSMENVIAADAKQIAQVSGIGPALAAAIYARFHQR